MDLPIYPRCHKDGRYTPSLRLIFDYDIDFKTDHLLFHGGVVERGAISNEFEGVCATTLIIYSLV